MTNRTVYIKDILPKIKLALAGIQKERERIWEEKKKQHVEFQNRRRKGKLLVRLGFKPFVPYTLEDADAFLRDDAFDDMWDRIGTTWHSVFNDYFENSHKQLVALQRLCEIADLEETISLSAGDANTIQCWIS